MIEALDRGNELYFRAPTPDELYEQLHEYIRLDWPEAIKCIATIRVNTFVDSPFLRDGKEGVGKMIFSEPQFVRGKISAFQRIPAPEYYANEYYVREGWMKVLQLKDAQFLDNEGNILPGEETDGWTPILDLASDTLTGLYSVEIREQDTAPLESEPNPEMLLDALEIMLPMHQEANRQNELMWATAFSLYGKGLSEEEFEAELKKVRGEGEEVDWSEAELASSMDHHLLERDVAGFHLANPNSLQAILRSGEFDYYGLHDKLHTTYKLDPRSPFRHSLLKNDPESKRVREEVWQEWQSILHEVAKRNGWTAYIDSEFNDRDELQIFVTNGEVTAEMHVFIKRWTGGSAISIAGSKYGITESHIRKTASLSRGVNSKTTNTWPISKEDHILDIENGSVNLADMSALEELTFFEQVLAAYL